MRQRDLPPGLAISPIAQRGAPWYNLFQNFGGFFGAMNWEGTERSPSFKQ
jgi:hypothetical protein